MENIIPESTLNAFYRTIKDFIERGKNYDHYIENLKRINGGNIPKEIQILINDTKVTSTENKEMSLYYECDRCEISSETEDRMCPCPRGSCEAEVVGTKEVVTTIKKNR